MVSDVSEVIRESAAFPPARTRAYENCPAESALET